MSVRNSEIEANGWTTFDVPNQFEDLQKQLATGSYYVQNVLDLADINTRLQSNFWFNSIVVSIASFRYLANSRTTWITWHLSIILQYCNVNPPSLLSSSFSCTLFLLVISIKCQSMDVPKQLKSYFDVRILFIYSTKEEFSCTNSNGQWNVWSSTTDPYWSLLGWSTFSFKYRQNAFVSSGWIHHSIW